MLAAAVFPQALLHFLSYSDPSRHTQQIYDLFCQTGKETDKEVSRRERGLQKIKAITWMTCNTSLDSCLKCPKNATDIPDMPLECLWIQLTTTTSELKAREHCV